MSIHLGAGAPISVDTCYEVLFSDPKKRKLDLKDKAAEHLAENAAIVVAQQHGDTLLNR